METERVLTNSWNSRAWKRNLFLKIVIFIHLEISFISISTQTVLKDERFREGGGGSRFYDFVDFIIIKLIVSIKRKQEQNLYPPPLPSGSGGRIKWKIRYTESQSSQWKKWKRIKQQEIEIKKMYSIVDKYYWHMSVFLIFLPYFTSKNNPSSELEVVSGLKVIYL